jgi:hypothetical protein
MAEGRPQRRLPLPRRGDVAVGPRLVAASALVVAGGVLIGVTR